jgi:glycosyltransferase involved in cell wall biosynthesis
MGPKISVIIPTYHRNGLLRDAIDSVLAQSYDPVELIVVDDSGTGHADPVFDEYGGQIDAAIRQPENSGWAGANTAGIEASSGEYVQLLDDDDMLLPEKLSKTAAALRADPETGVAYCGVIEEGAGRIRPKPEVRGDILEHALRFRTYPVWTGSMLIERDVLLDCLPLAGAGDDELRVPLGDSDLKIALAQRAAFEPVDECLAFYRREASRRWTGAKRFRKIRQTVAHRRELYAKYPRIRRAVLAEWSRKHGRYCLDSGRFTPESLAWFGRWAYHATRHRARATLAGVSSAIGRRESNGVTV